MGSLWGPKVPDPTVVTSVVFEYPTDAVITMMCAVWNIKSVVSSKECACFFVCNIIQLNNNELQL